jgi:hypothetical protein
MLGDLCSARLVCQLVHDLQVREQPQHCAVNT